MFLYYQKLGITPTEKPYETLSRLKKHPSRYSQVHSIGRPICDFTILYVDLIVVTHVVLWRTHGFGWSVLYSCFAIKRLDTFGRAGCSLFLYNQHKQLKINQAFTGYVLESNLVFKNLFKERVSSISSGLWWGCAYWCLPPPPPPQLWPPWLII